MHDQHHHVDFDSPAMATMAELEAEVLINMYRDAINVVAMHVDEQGVNVGIILDLGSGPGVGTCALAQRFGTAHVVAIDGSATMLEFAASRAERLGLADRVEARRVELPDGFGTLGPADVVWTSMFLHHIGDEEAALGHLRRLLRPAGVLALVERAGPVRVVAEDVDLGRPGLWARLDAASEAWFARMRAQLPGSRHSGDYSGMLAAAGFEVVVDRILTVTLEPPLDPRAEAFARQQLSRTQTQLADHADPADLRALDRLVDEGSDGAALRVVASRRLLVATPAP